MALAEPERALVREGAAGLGVALDDAAVRALGLYLSELELWRERVNLVSAASRAELLERHVLDSLAAVPLLLAEGASARIADVGSGAGLPGIPIAIAAPRLRVTLIEPRRKRASFLRAVARALGRPDLAVLEARAEAVGSGPAGGFDAVTTRATFPPAGLPGGLAALLRPGGLAIAYTGETADLAAGAGRESFEPPLVRPYQVLGRAGFQLVAWRRR